VDWTFDRKKAENISLVDFRFLDQRYPFVLFLMNGCPSALFEPDRKTKGIYHEGTRRLKAKSRKVRKHESFCFFVPSFFRVLRHSP
jgi:hypothetical protein